MTERTLKRLLAVLGVAIVVWLAASLLRSGGGDQPIAATGEITDFFSGLDGPSADAVRFTGADRTIELLPQGGDVWTVNGHPSDDLFVSRLLASLTTATAGDLAGTNPANHDRMGVSADSAVTLEVEIDGETRTLLLGNAGARAGRVYARLPGKDEVYLLEADLRAAAMRRLEDWRDKTMVEADTSRVTRIEVERGEEAYTIVRGDSTWTFEDGGETDRTTVRSLMSELGSLLASGFLEEGDSIAMLEEGASTVAYAENGEVLASISIGTGEFDRWARVQVPADPSVFRVPSFRVDRVAPELESVQAEEQTTPPGG